MILPEPVYNVLNYKKNFDFIFLQMLKNNNQEDAALPVPATYIINKDGTIGSRIIRTSII